ncbi:hypothetical protein [Herbaspirillum sp. ST 5-3]|uniref:hypothetical protein n=1 Tax=Oxalobacteraceae TaxID=75682 RepID=UPI0010A4E68C|nr:hypothetical protein [Herbaspirillum sp. ST 5-3]
MRFRSLKNWQTEFDISALLFFAQRMEELLFDYTLDTYKPSALNAPALCAEALLVLEDIESGVLDEANLKHVLDELEWSIHGDRVAKSMLEGDLSRYLPRSENVPYTERRLKLQVLAGVLNPYRYFERCVHYLGEAIRASKKKEIDELARTLCTTLINLGQSKHFLYKNTVDFFYYQENKFSETRDSFQAFIQLIWPYTHHFDVYFIASSLLNKIHEESAHFKVEKVDSIPEKLVEFSAKSGFVLKSDEVLVRINDIQSFDIYSARMEAESRLNKVRDLFVLFSHKAQLTWREEALIVQLCCEGEPAIVKKNRSSMEKGFDLRPAVAAKRMNWMLRNINLSSSGSFERFDRVVELHGIGVTHNIPENQLLNLWISLETLTPSHAGQNKVAGVVASLNPTLMLNYILRLVEQVASDLVHWDKYKTKKILKKISTQSQSIRAATLRLLTLQSCEPLRNELYAALSDFHLLRYRIFRLSESLSSPAKVKELLDLHERKVSWQIRRIYRTRNLVVHSGKAPSFIHALIENGHNYLDQVMSQVMLASCGEYNLNSLDQVFEFTKIRYERFGKQLAAIETFADENVEFLLVNQSLATSYTD